MRRLETGNRCAAVKRPHGVFPSKYKGRAMRTSGYFIFIIRNSRAALWACSLLLGAFAADAAVLEEARAAYTKAQYQEIIRLVTSGADHSLEARFLLGRAQYQLGQFSAAASTLEAAAAMAGASSEHHNWLGRAYGMQAESANPFSAMGLARKARDAFQKAVELDPKNLEAVSDLFSFYLAAPSFLGGGVSKARSLAETVKPLHAAEYAGMQAQLAEKEKNYGKAEASYREAIRLEPGRIGRWIDLARFYTRREQLPKADEALAGARKLQPEAARLLYDEADLLYRSRRDPSRALQLLRRYQGAAQGPEDPPPFETAQLIVKLEKLERDARGR